MNLFLMVVQLFFAKFILNRPSAGETTFARTIEYFCCEHIEFLVNYTEYVIRHPRIYKIMVDLYSVAVEKCWGVGRET
jgi:hypothetical protein